MKKLLYVLLLLLVSCDETFQTHPYDVNIMPCNRFTSPLMVQFIWLKIVKNSASD